MIFETILETAPVRSPMSSIAPVQDKAFWVLGIIHGHESLNNGKPSIVKMFADFQGADEGAILRVQSIKVEKFIN